MMHSYLQPLYRLLYTIPYRIDEARDGDSDCGTRQPKQYPRLTYRAFWMVVH